MEPRTSTGRPSIGPAAEAADKGEEPREGWAPAAATGGGMGAGRGPASSGSATVTGPSRSLGRPGPLAQAHFLLFLLGLGLSWRAPRSLRGRAERARDLPSRNARPSPSRPTHGRACRACALRLRRKTRLLPRASSATPTPTDAPMRAAGRRSRLQASTNREEVGKEGTAPATPSPFSFSLNSRFSSHSSSPFGQWEREGGVSPENLSSGAGAVAVPSVAQRPPTGFPFKFHPPHPQ